MKELTINPAYMQSFIGNAYQICSCLLLRVKVQLGCRHILDFTNTNRGQKFNMHKDGRQNVCGNETLFTFLIYLNDGCHGGETLFRQGNLKVSPKKGSAIVFEHHLWHQGVEVESGVKFVLRSDIVYS